MILLETLTNAMDLTYRVPKPTVGARAYLSSDQSNLTDNTHTLMNLATETFDFGNDFNTTTHLFTTPTAGLYYVHGNIDLEGAADGGSIQARIYYDGDLYTLSRSVQGAAGRSGVNVSCHINASASKTIGLYAYPAGHANASDANATYTYMEVILVGIP